MLTLYPDGLYGIFGSKVSVQTLVKQELLVPLVLLSGISFV